MVDTTLSVIAGYKELPKLAPDLNYIQDMSGGTAGAPHRTVTGINGSSGLVTALSLTGKHGIYGLEFQNISVENITIKLTVDDVVIWNSVHAAAYTSLAFFGSLASSDGGNSDCFQCDESLLLEVQTASDTSIDLDYAARPIL